MPYSAASSPQAVCGWLAAAAAGLKARLSSLSEALDEEKAARTLAAAEAEAR